MHFFPHLGSLILLNCKLFYVMNRKRTNHQIKNQQSAINKKFQIKKVENET